MNKPDKQITFWAVLSFFSAVYFLIRFFHPLFTETILEQQPLLVSKITGALEGQTLDFYLGRMEEVVWGPLTQLLSALLFTFFSLRYLKSVPAGVFGLAVFMFLLIAKFEVLFFPLYGDAIGGPFSEARWLAENNFDYAGLLRQDNFSMGGPKVYLTSVYPTFLAAMIKLIPASKPFLFVNHAVVFALAAAVFSFFRAILLKVFDGKTSLLVLMVFWSLPIFQSQAEAVNMEIPSVIFAVMAVYFMSRKDIPWAAFFAVVAMLVKDTAVVICGAVFAVSLYLFFLDEEKKFNTRILLSGLAGALLALGKVSIKFFLHDQDTVQNRISFLVGWPSLRWSFILAVYLASLIALLVHQFGRPASGKKAAGRIKSLFADHYIFWVMFVCASMWFVLFLNFFAVSPRYRLLLSPFLIFCFVYALNLFLKRKNVLNALLISAVSVFSFSSYGLFYAPMEENDHVLLERSLEYRNDLKVSRILAKEIESNYPQMIIAAPFIMAQSLAFPVLGYVGRDLDVMIYGMRCTYGGIKNFGALKEIDVPKTVWVGVKTQFFNDILPGFAYPVGPHDRILKEVVVGNKKATIFVGGFAIEKARIMLQMARERAAVLQPAPVR